MGKLHCDNVTEINTMTDTQLFNLKKITGSTTRYGLAIKIHLDQKLEDNS